MFSIINNSDGKWEIFDESWNFFDDFWDMYILYKKLECMND
jgi:hypothetical protein